MQQYSSRFFWSYAIVAVLFTCNTLACPLVVKAVQKDSTAIRTTVNYGHKQPILLGVFGASVLGISSTDFLQEYHRLGGTSFVFDAPLSLGVHTKIAIGNGLRVGGTAEGYRARFQDNYRQHIEQIVPLDTIRGFRDVYQDMQIKVVPVFATLEVVPVQAQFRTYAGVGIGVAYTQVYWYEALSSSLSGDKRTGGLHMDKQVITPAARLYTGIELGFDPNYTKQKVVLHSLFFEARYSYIPISVPLLQAVAKQIPNAPAHWQNPIAIHAGGFGLVVGITVEFAR